MYNASASMLLVIIFLHLYTATYVIMVSLITMATFAVVQVTLPSVHTRLAIVDGFTDRTVFVFVF